MGRDWKIKRDKGPIIYLPIDDNDMFDWRRDGIAESDFWEIVNVGVRSGNGSNASVMNMIGMATIAASMVLRISNSPGRRPASV
jgi:hypothetical protein